MRNNDFRLYHVNEVYVPSGDFYEAEICCLTSFAYLAFEKGDMNKICNAVCAICGKKIGTFYVERADDDLDVFSNCLGMR